MSQRKSEPDRYDPTQPPYEAYKVDFELFRILFGGLSPWGKCTQAESLSARLFRVNSIFINKSILLRLMSVVNFCMIKLMFIFFLIMFGENCLAVQK